MANKDPAGSAVNLGRPLSAVTPTVDADVLAVLAGATASFTGRKVHQIAGRHSERGVRNALHRLTEQGIVTRERVGSSDQYTLNRSHLAAPYIEGLAHLRRELLQRISAELETWKLPAEYVSLFGSAARGDMEPGSDIDLFVVRPTEVDADDDRWHAQLERLAHDVTGWTGNDARILEFSADEIRSRKQADGVLADIAADGLTLHGPGSYLKSALRAEQRGRRRG